MEGIIMADINAITSAISGQSVAQPQQPATPQPEAKGTTQQPKGDTVTISAQGKQAVQTPYSPAEEQKEPAVQKARETQVGKK
jgi:hypothetical protein